MGVRLHGAAPFHSIAYPLYILFSLIEDSNHNLFLFNYKIHKSSPLNNGFVSLVCFLHYF